MASFNGYTPTDQMSKTHSSANQRGNPISTLGFMMNMGYPPPPITYETLRKLCSAALDNPEGRITENQKNTILKEVKARPFAGSTAALFVIQQGLHSSKMERISCSLELVNSLVEELKIDFAQHINKEFMKSMIQVIKTNSYKERTVSGSIKKMEKWLTGSSASTNIVDPRAQALQKRALQMIQSWCDITRHSEYDVSPIHDAYRKLRSQQIQFPANDDFPTFPTLNDAYLETMRGFNSYANMPGSNPTSMTLTHPSIPDSARNYNGPNRSEMTMPASDTQIEQLQRAVVLVREQGNSVNHKERTVPVFTKLLPKVIARIDQLVDNNSTFEDERLLDQLFTLKEDMENVLADISDDPMKQIMNCHPKSNPFAEAESKSPELSPQIVNNTTNDITNELWPDEPIVQTEEKTDEDPFAALDDLLK